MTYLFFLIVALMLIFRDEFKKTGSHKEEFGNLLANALVIFLLSVQCFTGFYSVYYDYRYPYSPSKKIAQITLSGRTMSKEIPTAEKSLTLSLPPAEWNILKNTVTDMNFMRAR